ncbi:MAG: hypothetical protein V3T77_07495, partial [Planctomycetota bacterium]
MLCGSSLEFPKILGLIVVLVSACGASVQAQENSLGEGLVISRVGKYGRSAVHVDPIEAQIVAGTWSAPSAGDQVTHPDGTSKAWEVLSPGEDGGYQHEALRSGYAFFSVESSSERVMLLEASGHSMVYVNGIPRIGDPYQTGWVRLPVLLRTGANTFLFFGRRSQLKAKLVLPAAAVLLNTSEVTLPDLITGREEITWGSVLVIRASTEPFTMLYLLITLEERSAIFPLPELPPLTQRKVAFPIEAPAYRGRESCTLQIKLLGKKNNQLKNLDEAKLSLRVRDPGELHKRTFQSDIDGSIQYYSILPAKPVKDDSSSPALFLTLHGAGVEASRQ